MSVEVLAARLGVGPGLLEVAVTHGSFGAGSYERLEFLGDRVLNLAVAAWLYELYPAADEGELGLRHTRLVQEATLAGVAVAWHLEQVVKVGPGETVKPRILADVVEAVLGAVWLEEGTEKATALVRQWWQPWLAEAGEKDAKTRLQELLQAEGQGLPEYSVVEEGGLEHARRFVVQVACPWGEARGEGASKQAASRDAAEILLKQIGR